MHTHTQRLHLNIHKGIVHPRKLLDRIKDCMLSASPFQGDGGGIGRTTFTQYVFIIINVNCVIGQWCLEPFHIRLTASGYCQQRVTEFNCICSVWKKIKGEKSLHLSRAFSSSIQTRLWLLLSPSIFLNTGETIFFLDPWAAKYFGRFPTHSLNFKHHPHQMHHVSLQPGAGSEGWSLEADRGGVFSCMLLYTS